MEWVSVKDGLPKPDERRFDCLVCVTSIIDGGVFEDWKMLKAVEQVCYDSIQKLWVFRPDECGYLNPPINALVPESEFVGEDGELLEIGDFVTHWMPLPELPKEE